MTTVLSPADKIMAALIELRLPNAVEELIGALLEGTGEEIDAAIEKYAEHRLRERREKFRRCPNCSDGNRGNRRCTTCGGTNRIPA